MGKPIRVTVWSEHLHERKNAVVAKIYPEGIHHCIADGLREDAALEVGTATLDEEEHGLTESLVAETGRPPLVGARRAWRGGRRSRRTRTQPHLGRDGIYRAAFGALLENF